MDAADLGQRLEHMHRNIALKRRVPRPQQPSENCIDCDVRISDERRAAEPEANRCTDCKRLKEINHGAG